MDSTLTDRIHGVLYGHAVGDALGLGAESLSKHNISLYYLNGLTHYSQIVQDFHRLHWPVAAWTDDTGQMLCILDSLVEKRTIDVLDIAYRLHYWATHGGKSILCSTLRVICGTRILLPKRYGKIQTVMLLLMAG